MSARYAASIAVYYLTLIVYLLFSFYPDLRVWGLNWWAFYPLWIRLALFGVGAVVPAVLQLPAARRFLEPSDKEDEKSGWMWWVVPVAAGLLFWFGRVSTHFLGDGYTLLSSLSEGRTFAFKAREVGESLAHVGLFNLLGGETEATATLSYQIIAVVAGVLFAALVGWAATRLPIARSSRILFVIGCLSGGYSLMFFGYVENYSLFIVAVAAFVLTSLLALIGRLNRWWALAAFIVSVFMHVLGLVLLPGLVVVLLSDTSLGRRIGRWSSATRGLLVVLTVVLGVAAFTYLRGYSYFFRFAFLPPVIDRFTVDGQTLFSIRHWLDYLNLWLLLVPGLAISVPLLLSSRPGKAIPRTTALFFWLTCGAAALAVFLLDPKLGMPRDWDLFSFAAVPAIIGVLFYLLHEATFTVDRARAAVLFCTLSLLVLIPRVGAQSEAGIILEHVRIYKHLDPNRCQNMEALLSHYGELKGDPKAEQLWRDEWDERYPSLTLFHKGVAELNDRKYEAALRLFEQSVDVNPGFWNSWTMIGACYVRLNQPEKALESLAIALGLNPHGISTFNNLGAAYLLAGDYGQAEVALKEAVRLDSVNLAPYLGMITLYSRTADRAKYEQTIKYVISRPDAPIGVFEQYINFMANAGRVQEARQGLEEAIRRGMDSVRALELRKQYKLP